MNARSRVFLYAPLLLTTACTLHLPPHPSRKKPQELRKILSVVRGHPEFFVQVSATPDYLYSECMHEGQLPLRQSHRLSRKAKQEIKRYVVELLKEKETTHVRNAVKDGNSPLLITEALLKHGRITRQSPLTLTESKEKDIVRILLAESKNPKCRAILNNTLFTLTSPSSTEGLSD